MGCSAGPGLAAWRAHLERVEEAALVELGERREERSEEDEGVLDVGDADSPIRPPIPRMNHIPSCADVLLQVADRFANSRDLADSN